MRPGGSLTGGCGFSSFWSGTDFSQQDAPAVSVADGVTNGTATVTSATAAFAAPMTGNGLNIASDGLYQIIAVNSATSVTVDRNTANGGAGRGLKVGGAGGGKGTVRSAIEPEENSVLIPGHVVWVKNSNAAGVLTNYVSSGGWHILTSGQEENYIRIEGYNLVRGDGGIANTVQVGTWSGTYITVRGLQMSTSFGGNTLQIGGAGQIIENIIADATGTSGYALANSGVVAIRRAWIKGGTNVAAVRDTSGSLYEYCRVDAGTGQAGISVESGAVSLNNCILKGGLAGVQINAISGFLKARGCVFYGASSYGLDISPTAQHFDQGSVVEGCIFDTNGLYDIAWRQASPAAVTAPGGQNWVNSAFKCNYFHTTGTGRYLSMVAAADDTALTVSPFIAPAAGNFNLNATAGGGLVISASPCTQSFPDGVNSSLIIGGFYGSLPVVTSAATTTLRSLWRERTNERSYTATSSGVPDSAVDIYLDWALQWINRIARYHFTTDSASLALVAGTQEYAPFTDLVEAIYVRYGDKQLQKGDVERWRGDDLEWDKEPAGEPREFAQYGLNIIFRPTPSAEAVAANPTCTVRYVSTPPSITTNGPEQLPTQAYRIVVDYAAAAWFMGYPDTALAEQKMQALLKEAQEAAMLFKEEISRRSIAK